MAELQLRLRITETKGANPTTLLKSLEQKFSKEAIQRDLAVVKNKVLEHVAMFINANRQREVEQHTMYGAKEGFRFTLKNNLINVLREGSSIEHTEDNKIRLGIGSKKYLNTYARYWYVVNYGKKFGGGVYIPPKTYGYFGTGEKPIALWAMGGKKQAFHHTNTGRKKGEILPSLLQPNKPITPMHYLEEMTKVFEIEIALLEQKYRNELNRLAKSSEKESFLKTISLEKREQLLSRFGIDVEKWSESIIKQYLSRL